jgi:hypothetical protein
MVLLNPLYLSLYVSALAKASFLAFLAFFKVAFASFLASPI